VIRVAVADDHPHVAIALRALVEQTHDIRLVAESRRGEEVLALVRRVRPDVLFLDLLMEQTFDAQSVIRDLRAGFPQLRICILSAYIEPARVRALLQAGVSGYILKDDDYVSQIDSIIRDLAEGRLYLSPQAYEALAMATRTEAEAQSLTDREVEVLRLASDGLSNAKVARALHISAGTVRNHLSSAYRKLGVHSRHEALQVAADRHLI
jgi:DNA-binding NarL/FixJ family response regulator